MPAQLEGVQDLGQALTNQERGGERRGVDAVAGVHQPIRILARALRRARPRAAVQCAAKVKDSPAPLSPRSRQLDHRKRLTSNECQIARRPDIEASPMAMAIVFIKPM